MPLRTAVTSRIKIKHRQNVQLVNIAKKVTCPKGHLSQGLYFVRNGAVQIPKFDAKPNPNSNPIP